MSQYSDALIQSMLQPRGGMTPGQAINQGTGQLMAALAARKEKQQQAQLQQLQQQIAQQLLGGGGQQALQSALSNPQAVQGNPLLAQLLMTQMKPEEDYTLPPGAVRMKGSKQLAANPAPEKPGNLEQMLALTGLKPGTPEYQKAAQDYINKPGVQITNEYGSIPSGYKRIRDPSSPSGTRLVKEEGGPADKLPAETAAKLGMLDASEKSLAEAEKVLFPDGGYDRKSVTATWSPVRTGSAAKLYNSLREAVSARLRAESGATITPADIDDMTERYLPKPWDSKAEAEARFRRFRQFVSSYRNSVRGTQPVKLEDLPE
jgi:hypothetical protein